MPIILPREISPHSPNLSFGTPNRQILACKTLMASALVGGLAFSSDSWAQQPTPQINEPRSETQTYALRAEVRPRLVVGADVSNLVACTISGTVTTYVPQPHPLIKAKYATSGEDFVLKENRYSVRIQPRRGENGEIILESAYDEVLFDILADEEVEGAEYVSITTNPYDVTCEGGVAPYITLMGVYGTFIINDPSAPAQSNAIPVRQKSLSTQLNSLRTLSLHNSITRDRSIAKEIDRAR